MKDNHPGPNKGRDPFFIELEKNLDSDRLRDGVAILMQIVFYGMLIIIFLILAGYLPGLEIYVGNY